MAVPVRESPIVVLLIILPAIGAAIFKPQLVAPALISID